MKRYNIIIGIFILVIIILLYFSFRMTNTNNVTIEDDIYMFHFDVYGDFLFQMYGILGLIKSIFYDLNNLNIFNKFFKESKQLFQYKNGDIIEFKSGKVDFSTKILQKKYKKTQTYIKVLYPINEEYYIEFYRIIKFLDLSEFKLSKRKVDENRYKQIISNYNLSLANKELLFNFIKTDLIDDFTNSLGYSYTLQYFIYKYDNFERALNIIKKYHKLFISKYGEGVFVRKNTNTMNPFSFENNNDNYVFQNDYWIYYYDTNVEKNKNVVGKNPTESYKYLTELYKKANYKRKNVNIAETIVYKLIKGGSIITYEWFNNVMLQPFDKKSVIFGYKQYYYGSGYNYKV